MVYIQTYLSDYTFVLAIFTLPRADCENRTPRGFGKLYGQKQPYPAWPSLDYPPRKAANGRIVLLLVVVWPNLFVSMLGMLTRIGGAMPKIFWIVMTLLLLPGNALAQSFGQRLGTAAIERTRHQVRYDGRYLAISYPGGDVPADTGVCTDVVIRAYRTLGTDLQVAVHQDMLRHFDAYPSGWGLTQPDTNIDHRRVPNLQVFFTRHGKVLPMSKDPKDYAPGDLVTWMLAGNRPHIGIVTSRKDLFSKNLLVAHNAGAGPKLEDVLFAWPMTGHYRYTPNPIGEAVGSTAADSAR